MSETHANRPITINGETVYPGESREIDLFAAKLYDFTDVYMPVKVFCGKEDGSRLFVCAAVHGDEINGIGIISRLVKSKQLKKLRGTLVVVPIVNVFGFNSMSRYLPDRRDLNRSFPGSPSGSLASRLANLFVSEVMDQCTHGIDLHTGSRHRTNLPQLRVCLKDKRTRDMAHEFGVPVILDADLIDGSLRKTAFEKKIPLLVFEGGECLRYDELSIRSGLRGVLNTMRFLNMLPPDRRRTRRIEAVIAKGSYWERAVHSGIFVIKARLGSVIQKDSLLGYVTDPLGTHVTEIRAKSAGIIIGHTHLPPVNQGDALFHIATFAKLSQVSQSLERFDDQFDTQEGGAF